MGSMIDYSQDGGRRFYCKYNDKKYYLASHRYYSKDKFDDDSTLLIVHKDPWFHGENFTCDYFSNGICLYYKDNRDGMRNWMLYIHKQSNNDYFIPMFHRSKCSKFILETIDDTKYFYIKETQNNVYLYMNEAQKRDDNSYYVGATSEKNKATRFKYIDIIKK